MPRIPFRRGREGGRAGRALAHARRVSARGWALVLAVMAVGALTAAEAQGASADAGTISAQYQGYSGPGSEDPYAGSNPQDVHVDGFGGQPVVTGLIRLNLECGSAASRW